MTYVSEAETPVRSILIKRMGAISYWGCAGCDWRTPFTVVEGKPNSAIAAVEQFQLHNCAANRSGVHKRAS